MARLLDSINSPQDLKGLNIDQLRQLCVEIRSYMVECCSRNPGHLASSLGAVELIVGVHYVYNTPQDKVVFDVGHQAYAHKILTGRREAFASARTREGISGFPRRQESPYDAFGAGHASTSISAALGMAEAAKLQGAHSHSIAFIGDGALTGGLALEGLNNAGNSGTDLLVILNDNNQSIERNLGGLHNHLLKIRTSKAYGSLKDIVWKSLGETATRTWVQRSWKMLKSRLFRKMGGVDMFESLGMRYFGPINGNDIAQVVETLQRIKDLKGPRVLHALTVKGKGYAPAEADPTIWHAPGRFDPETGERQVTNFPADRFQDVFGEVLVQLAHKDSRVVGVTPAMASGCGMTRLATQMPDRFFDVGIEEEHAVTFSAGLAASGLRPFCNIYSAFSQRAYDEIIHDVALQDLPVVLCFDRAGLVGEDGSTHHGAFDLSAYRSIPGAIIEAPRDEVELKQAMYTALQQEHGPYIIRYPRGCAQGSPWRDAPFETHAVGRGSCVRDGGHSRLAVLGLGPVVYRAIEAAQMLLEESGEQVSVYDMRYLKPLDEELLEDIFASHTLILTAEDGALKGGLYGAVCEWAAARDLTPNHLIHGVGIPDEFISHARQSEQQAYCGIDKVGILSAMTKLFEKSPKSFGE